MPIEKFYRDSHVCKLHKLDSGINNELFFPTTISQKNDPHQHIKGTCNFSFLYLREFMYFAYLLTSLYAFRLIDITALHPYTHGISCPRYLQLLLFDAKDQISFAPFGGIVILASAGTTPSRNLFLRLFFSRRFTTKLHAIESNYNLINA